MNIGEVVLIGVLPVGIGLMVGYGVIYNKMPYCYGSMLMGGLIFMQGFFAWLFEL